MRIARIALAALIALVPAAGTVALAPAVAAGGPTSVLLTAPTLQQATALYHSDAEYSRLLLLLDDVDTSTTLGSGGWNGEIRATWMIHDVAVWRVDRIRIDGSGQARVYTEDGYDDIDPFRQDTDWHPVADSEALVDLLAGLGLAKGPAGKDLAKAEAKGTDKKSTDAEGTVAVAVPGPSTGTPSPVAAQAPLAEAGAAGAAPGTSWALWAIGGFVVGGVAAGLVLTRVRGLRRRPGLSRT